MIWNWRNSIYWYTYLLICIDLYLLAQKVAFAWLIFQAQNTRKSISPIRDWTRLNTTSMAKLGLLFFFFFFAEFLVQLRPFKLTSSNQHVRVLIQYWENCVCSCSFMCGWNGSSIYAKKSFSVRSRRKLIFFFNYIKLPCVLMWHLVVVCWKILVVVVVVVRT